MPYDTRTPGTTETVRLDRPGWAIHAPGVIAQLNVTWPTDRGPGMRSSALDSDLLDDALERAGITELATITVDTERLDPAVGAGLRAPSNDQDAFELEVPALDAHAQVVLMADEAGGLSWHFPVDAPAWGERDSVLRGGGGESVLFRIPRGVAPAPDQPGETAQRSLIRRLGKKVLKVVLLPLVDPLLEVGSRYLAGAWERKNRDYRVRPVSVQDYGTSEVADLDGDGWRRMGEGKALLLVHGTFSSSHASFGGLPRELVVELQSRYDGRILAFDHFTLSETPLENARTFLERMPGDVRLQVDILCHSRGGLVARSLGQRPNPLQLENDRVQVDRLVMAGVPNAGTILTDRDHLVELLNRTTMILDLFPTGVVGDVLDAVLTVVKVVGGGAVEALTGLQAMRPGGAFLQRLNGDGVAGTYYAIAADYEPVDSGLRWLVSAGADAVMDRVFQDRANDLVVPERGVWDASAPGFPVEESRLLRLPADRGVLHTTIFGSPEVADRLQRWLHP